MEKYDIRPVILKHCLLTFEGEEDVPCNERPSNYETTGPRVGQGWKGFQKITLQFDLSHRLHFQVPQGKKETLLSKYEEEKNR